MSIRSLNRPTGGTFNRVHNQGKTVFKVNLAGNQDRLVHLPDKFIGGVNFGENNQLDSPGVVIERGKAIS